MFTYTIMPDYGMASYAWVKNSGDMTSGVGGAVADATGWYGAHPLSKDLAADLSEWAIEFERNAECEVEAKMSFDWHKFHERGLTLARRVKAELGSDVRIIYEKPSEDPGCAVDERREILPDGSIKRVCPIKKP